ncbi:MAG: TRAM domain-containing protein, partial [Deltaproteobacteria bacterium]|nr:TRAM domain-containing protein [Deltaproteobacteria bacterium]
VLEKMYRTYTREEYLKIIRQLREQCPEIALSTDIIIGFPGETDDDFEHTLSLLDEVQFDFAFSFNYSPRPHTTAGRYFEDDVSQVVKEKRLHLLQEKQLKKSYELNQNCVGSTYIVLVEGPSKMGETLQGRSSQNRIIHFPIDPAVKVGDFVKVKVTKATPTSLVGESVP